MSPSELVEIAATLPAGLIGVLALYRMETAQLDDALCSRVVEVEIRRKSRIVEYDIEK